MITGDWRGFAPPLASVQVYSRMPHSPGEELGVIVGEGRAGQAGEQVGTLPVGKAGGVLGFR